MELGNVTICGHRLAKREENRKIYQAFTYPISRNGVNMCTVRTYRTFANVNEGLQNVSNSNIRKEKGFFVGENGPRLGSKCKRIGRK